MEPAWTGIVNTCLAISRAVVSGVKAIRDRAQAADRAKVDGAQAWQPMQLDRIEAGWTASIGYAARRAVTVTRVVAVRPRGTLVALANRKSRSPPSPLEPMSEFAAELLLSQRIGPRPLIIYPGASGPPPVELQYLHLMLKPPPRPWWARGKSTPLRLDVDTEWKATDRRKNVIAEVERTHRVTLLGTIDWAEQG